MKIDLLSDIHLDAVPDLDLNSFLHQIISDTPGDVFLFAGDFGYDNSQNLAFLSAVSGYYHQVLFILGNNDTKILPQPYPFKDAKDRVESFLYKAAKLKNVSYIDGKIKVNDIVFAGSNLYFDCSYLKKQFSLTDDEILQLWEEKQLNLKHLGYIDNPFTYSEQEKAKLFHALPEANVIVTHSSPGFMHEGKLDTPGFYTFDADEIKTKINRKVWVYGHKHERFAGEQYGCRFYNVSYISGQVLSIEI